MRKKLLGVTLACILLMGCFVGCAKTESGIELPFYDQSADQNYNPELFYRNDMTTYSADPTVLWVSEEQDPINGGYFYMYSTGDAGNVSCFGVNRSKNMIDWEFVDTVFMPEAGSWAQNRLYAPECIYDAEEEKYYLFFSASWEDRRFGPVFDSYADKAVYDAIKATVLTNYNTLVNAQAEYDRLKTVFEPIEPINGYTADQWQEAKQLIAKCNGVVAPLTVNSEKLKVYQEYIAVLQMVNHATVNIPADKMLGGTGASGGNYFYYGIGVAVADSPVGPFKQYTNVSGDAGYSADERTIGIGRPLISHEDFYEALAKLEADGETAKYQKLQAELSPIVTMIDADPFVDPKTGDKYLYFSSVRSGLQHRQEYICGLKIGDRNSKWTDDPQFDTAIKLLRYGYTTVDGEEQIDYPHGQSTIQEAPFMMYDEETEKYYLTFSINGAYEREYCVGQAIGDTPLGAFEKVPAAQGGLVIASDSMWDHVCGSGHHCFLQYDGKLYVFYQGLYERASNQSNLRGICVDEVISYVNSNGTKVYNANGPTYAPMPKLGPDAQYRNIAGDATVSVNRGDKKEALNDGRINIMTYHDETPEFSATSGSTTITLDFADYRTLRAIMVFNARDRINWFDKIDRIELDFVATKNGSEVKNTAYMRNLVFDKDLYTHEAFDLARPGGSVCAEFNEIRVKTVRITINSSKNFSISEIYLLGK